MSYQRIALLVMPLWLAGCAGGITGIALDPLQRSVCDSSGVCGVSDMDTAVFQVLGQGKCDKIGVTYGDGERVITNGNFYFFNPAQIPFMHQYTTQHPLGPRAWPGPKVVHAFSVTNCAGEARMRVNVLREGTNLSGQVTFDSSVRVGMAANPLVTTACNVPTNTRPVLAGATVSITEVPGGPVVNFGGGAGANNTAGNSGATHPGFPFPAMRRHSLVLRIVSATGTQVVQGGPATRFVVAATGPLEFCFNDTVLTDNTGAWAMDVAVDESTIP